MDFNQFHKDIQRKANEIRQAMKEELPLKIESEVLKFVDDNFRNQGWEGEKWKESDGTILVKSGALRRGFESEAGDGQVRLTNDVKYAVVNNEGFDGEVSVPEHERVIYVKSGAKKKKSGKVKVKAHKRKVKTPKRQFAPFEGSESKTLNTAINGIIDNTINTILKP